MASIQSITDDPPFSNTNFQKERLKEFIELSEITHYILEDAENYGSCYSYGELTKAIASLASIHFRIENVVAEETYRIKNKYRVDRKISLRFSLNNQDQKILFANTGSGWFTDEYLKQLNAIIRNSGVTVFIKPVIPLGMANGDQILHLAILSEEKWQALCNHEHRYSYNYR